MKKFFAVILALCLALGSMTACAETAFFTNAKQFVQENLNLQNSDIKLDLEMDGSTFTAQVGSNEKGINGVLSMSEIPVGQLLLASDAGYVSFMGQTMAVKFETVGKYFNKIAEQFTGTLADSGVDPQSIMNDLQTVAMKVITAVQPLLGAVNIEQTEEEMIVKLDGTTFASAIDTMVTTLSEDAELKEIFDRYASILSTLGVETSASFDWNGNKEEALANLAKTEAELHLLKDGTYTLNATAYDGEKPVNISSEGSVDAASQAIDTKTTITEEDKTSTIIFTANESGVVYDATAEDTKIYEKFVLEQDMLKAADITFTKADETVFDAHYADYKVTFSVPAQNLEMVIEKGFSDDLNFEILISATVNGEIATGRVLYSLEGNALSFTAELQGQTFKMVLAPIEKGEYNDLSASESIQWITEEMLDQLFGSVMNALPVSVEQ